MPSGLRKFMRLPEPSPGHPQFATRPDQASTASRCSGVNFVTPQDCRRAVIFVFVSASMPRPAADNIFCHGPAASNCRFHRRSGNLNSWHVLVRRQQRICPRVFGCQLAQHYLLRASIIRPRIYVTFIH